MIAAVTQQPTTISFIVPAVPVAQPRAVATNIHGHARVYEPRTVKTATGRQPHPIAEFKAAVKMAARQAYSGPPLDCPLIVDVTFVFPRPAGLFWKTKPMPRLPHAKKPDRDNCDKAVLDALKGLCWVDDCQACSGRIEKWIASGSEQPHVEVRIETYAGMLARMQTA